MTNLNNGTSDVREPIKLVIYLEPGRNSRQENTFLSYPFLFDSVMSVM